MGFLYSAALLLSIVWTTYAIGHNNLALVTPSRQKLTMTNDAGEFLVYRNAVAAYMAAHTTFIGTVPAASLTGQYSQTFLATASNVVTATGTAGRIITSYAKVSAGAIQTAEVRSGGDVSIGVSNGTTWTSAAPNAVKTPSPLNTAVPVGDIVSVFQIGS